MAAVSGTGTSLTSKFYLRDFYVSNRNASSSSKRKDLSKNTLSHADAEALFRAVKKLRTFNYEDESSDGANIYSSIRAYIETYNNALDSSKNSSDVSLERYSKYLKNLSDKYMDKLEDIGITIEKDGSLTANENLLKNADLSDVKKLFSKDSEYLNQTSRYAKRMITKAENAIFSEQILASKKAKENVGTANPINQALNAAANTQSLLANGIGTNVNISL